MIDALDIHVKGVVQGVGFRPFVYRLAKRYLISGWVLNAADGVHIHAEGESDLVDQFVLALSDEAPQAARVKEIEMREVPLEQPDGFEIRFSDDAAAAERTLVSPDLALCDACAAELHDPENRRYRYPFINCTDCGPRFTIIDDLPYDRRNTSMSVFPMCDACQAEYDDPGNRRFHAQPNACFSCNPGPALTWRIGRGAIERGRTREQTDAIFAAAVDVIARGGIVAVKGLGGFHLVCDANNERAVAELRRRKGRDGKPFAVMMQNAGDVCGVCEVGDEERALLEGAVRPIVLLRKRIGASFAPGLADGLPELGVMLPYTPVQRILIDDFADAFFNAERAQAGLRDAGNLTPMLVMTSGNIHDEPIVTSDEEAYEKLAGVADAFLGNDREIRTRFDDSVVRVIDAAGAGRAVQVVRRARGYAPDPIPVDADAGTALADPPGNAASQPVVFAAGPMQKNTFAFLRGGQAFVSQHIGDLENAATFDAWLDAKARFQRLFQLRPTAIACDMHPEYLASKWAREQADATGLPLIEVQHHHAHIVSVMAEHGIEDAVCGIAFDGTGFGPDGAIWGGEVLISNQQAFERFANFAYVPMPGGAACVHEPLRMAYGVLWEFDLLDHPGAAAALEALGAEQAQVCETMIDRGLNTPYTSSVGRLFDAASALLGVCRHPTYEGEPAIMLEAAMGRDATAADDRPYEIAVVKNTATAESTAQDTSVVLFDAAPAFRALLDDLAAGVPTAVIARRFHDAFVAAIATAAQLVASLYGITAVALSGGVFMNRYLIEHALAALEKAGFTVAINRDLPPNDGCISLGEAVVAARTLAQAPDDQVS